jgi:hypothetical protein
MNTDQGESILLHKHYNLTQEQWERISDNLLKVDEYNDYNNVDILFPNLSSENRYKICLYTRLQVFRYKVRNKIKHLKKNGSILIDDANSEVI